MKTLGLEWFWFVVVHIFRLFLDCVWLVLSPWLLLVYFLKREIFLTRKKFPCILITGGSSGIGRSLAIEFIKSSTYIQTLIITGRNEQKLKETIDICKKNLKNTNNKNIILLYKRIDVRNNIQMNQYINELNDQYHLDLVIANAGVSVRTITNESTHYSVTTKELFDTNVTGVLNTINPVIQIFQKRYQNMDNNKHYQNSNGHIAITGSLSGYLATCDSCSYSAAKSMIRYLCEDLRPQIKKQWNIDLTWIGPAFTGTDMCPEEFNKNRIGFRTSEQAAKIIKDGLEWNEECIDFPKHVFTLAWLFGSVHPILFSLVSDYLCSEDYAVYNLQP